MSVSHQIYKLFFSNEFVLLDVGLEGQTCQENSYIIGSRTGPVKSISGLLHEICHFAELEPERLLKFPGMAWGLKQGKFWQVGHKWGYEPMTDQQVQREARVWAFQLSAEKYFGIGDSAQELVSSAKYLPAWCWYQQKHSKNINGYQAKDKKALYYLAKHVERLAKHNPFEKLVNDYSYRINFLRNSTSVSVV